MLIGESQVELEKSESQSVLNKERQETDSSLDAERDKANKSLNSVRNKTEEKTDSDVNAERHSADRLTKSSRIESDKASDKKNGSIDSQARASQDKQLNTERRAADQATELERVRTDAALVKERQTKENLENQFLEDERKKTDKNLSVERTRTDLEVDQHSILLNAEIAEHLKTKTNLTSRDEFLAIVSHDLKNPIGTASLCAEMLLEDAAFKKLNIEVRGWVELIKRNTDTALRLIGDLLDMERVAEGKLQIKLGHHDIGQIIREAVETFARPAAAKKILLRVMPSDISGQILCDRDRVTQVITNLLNNAIKFTPQNGSVTVEANLNDIELQVSVSDTGPGIPNDMKGKIFERFVQLSSTDRKGLGLGLHISKMLVEAHEGRLWVHSKMGEGSTFYFILPRKPVKQNGFK